MNIYRTIPLYVLSLIAMLFTACTDPNGWKNVDVSNIKTSLKVSRFERDFYAIDTAHLVESEAKLRARYGTFYDDYIHAIMRFGSPADRMDTAGHDPHIDMLHFFANAADRALYDTVQHLYPDTRDIEAQLTDALRHLQYYFPHQPVRQVYTMITEFAHGAANYGDSILLIGLDMYLGEQYHYYDGLGFPQYMRRKLRREYIVPNAMEVVYMYNLHLDQTPYNAELPLIEAMINEGKKMYYLECMMPTLPDSILIGYTRQQEEWCRRSEHSIWQYLNEQDLLYKVNLMEQKRYTTDGPTTAGMPPESPGRVGTWIGWQIVRRYMRQAGGAVTLPDLLTHHTAKEIFAKANYKPK